MNKRMKAETLTGLLLAISLFALLCLSFLKWQAEQHRSNLTQYQQQQALLIAENQIHRRLAGIPCERSVEQNGLKFRIEKCTPQEIQIRFPNGELRITPPS